MVQTDTTDRHGTELTTIDGVGPATAQLLAEAGHTTVKEVLHNFLAGGDVTDHIAQTQRFYRWVTDNYEAYADTFNLYDTTPAEVQAYHYHERNDPPKRYTGDVPEKPADIGFDDGAFLCEAQVVALAPTAEAMAGFLAVDGVEDSLRPTMGTPSRVYTHYDAENDTDCVVFEHPDGGTTIVSEEFLERLSDVIDFNREDILCPPGDMRPVVIEAERTDLTATVAPRLSPEPDDLGDGE